VIVILQCSDEFNRYYEWYSNHRKQLDIGKSNIVSNSNPPKNEGPIHWPENSAMLAQKAW